MKSNTTRDRLTYILIAVIIVMGIEIIYLVIQNRILKGIIADPMKYFQTLRKEDTVPPFTAKDINGEELSVSYSEDAPHTVLLWFGSTCSSCDNNVAFWKDIHREYHSEGLRFLGMFIGNPPSARKFNADNEIEFPVICATRRYLVDMYKGHVLPQTMLIAPDGVIEGIWPGILNEETETEIIEILRALTY